MKLYKLIQAYFPFAESAVGMYARENLLRTGFWVGQGNPDRDKREIMNYPKLWMKVANFSVESYKDGKGNEYFRKGNILFLDVFGNPYVGDGRDVKNHSIKCVFTDRIYTVGDVYLNDVNETESEILGFTIFKLSCKIDFLTKRGSAQAIEDMEMFTFSTSYSNMKLKEKKMHSSPIKASQLRLGNDIWKKLKPESAWTTGDWKNSRMMGVYDLFHKNVIIEKFRNSNNGEEFQVGDVVDINGNKDYYIAGIRGSMNEHIQDLALSKVGTGSKVILDMTNESFFNIKLHKRKIADSTCEGYIYAEDKLIVVNKKSFSKRITYGKELDNIFIRTMYGLDDNWIFKTEEKFFEVLKAEQVTLSAARIVHLVNQ